jgi:hypothetical protein
MNKTLLLVLAAAGLYYFSRGGGGVPMFTLPNGRQVPESQLPSLGYFYNDGSRGGRPGWYHQSQLPTNLQPPTNVQPGSRQWYDYIAPVLNTGASLWTSISPFFTNRGSNPPAPTPTPTPSYSNA